MQRDTKNLLYICLGSRQIQDGMRERKTMLHKNSTFARKMWTLNEH